MAPFTNAKGQPVKMSFMDLFGPSTPSRGGKGTSQLERKKSKKEESSSTETSPQSTAATEASSESTKTTESGSAEWTRIEELALLGMKAQNMTWKEINEALPGKALDDIKNKYRALYLDAPASAKPKEAEAKKEETKKTENTKEDKKEENKGEAKGGEAKAAEEKKQGSKDNKKSGEGKQGRKGQKGQKGQRGKQKAEEAEVEEAQSEVKMGILKAKARAEGVGQGGELESIHGHPVIFVDDNEELEYEELLYLYALNMRHDEQKWITLDSKFFDKFGKRIGAQKLKEKLGGTS